MYRVLKGYRLLQATDGSCQLYLDNGRELIKLMCAQAGTDHDPGTGTLTELPVATANTIGGAKVQPNSGLLIDPDGNLSIDAATPEETQEVIDESFRDN